MLERSSLTKSSPAGVTGAYHDICISNICIHCGDALTGTYTPVFCCISPMTLRSDGWYFCLPGGAHPTWPHSPDNLQIPQHKTTQLRWWNFFHSNMPSPPARALLCQTCAALLNCWITNVHKHFKRWGEIAVELARWSCIWWGYCFRQRGREQSIFWANNLLMERSQMIKSEQPVSTPRRHNKGKHLRALVLADLCVYLLLRVSW